MSIATIAFCGARRLTAGSLAETTAAVRAARAAGEVQTLIVFDARTSEQLETDASAAADANAPTSPLVDPESQSPRGRGRPRLGVTAREVTLLPRHWDWLGRQSGGASAALRRLVEAARRADSGAGDLKQARESLYRFATVMAGDAPGYEEAMRALFAGDADAFEARISGWPEDVRDHAETLADAAFGGASPSLAAIAPTRRAAVRRALRAAFPAAVVSAPEPMAGGATDARVYRVAALGVDWVLRLDGRPDPHRDAARQFPCMAIAQAAGVAPPTAYTDATEGLSISRLVTQRPAEPPLSRAQRLTAVARVVRRLHAAPLFPDRGDYLETMEGIVAAFSTGPVPSPDAAARLVALWRKIQNAYPRNASRVSSHNDVNPSNVLFDGERPWIIDWDAAMAADPMVDVASVANWFAADEAEVKIVLDAYFDGAPDPGALGRFEMMRQVNRLFYGVMLINAAAAERPDLRVSASDLANSSRLAEIRPRMASLGSWEGRLLFGLAFLREALDEDRRAPAGRP